MLDQGADGARLQRVTGRAAVSLRADGRIGDLHQAGAAKVLLPKMHGRPPEVVFLNTAGGVTGGDRLDYDLTLEAGMATATTQTAERAYRSIGPVPGRITANLAVGARASLAWVPQETIVFDGADLDRCVRADMAGEAELLLADALVLGRQAMGETVSQLRLRDRREVWRDGRPVVLDVAHLADADLASHSPAGLGGARAMAAVHMLAPDAEDRLSRLRGVLPDDGSAAASAWHGRLSLRILATNPQAMRQMLARSIETLTQRPLPRVWQH